MFNDLSDSRWFESREVMMIASIVINSWCDDNIQNVPIKGKEKKNIKEKLVAKQMREKILN